MWIFPEKKFKGVGSFPRMDKKEAHFFLKTARRHNQNFFQIITFS